MNKINKFYIYSLKKRNSILEKIFRINSRIWFNNQDCFFVEKTNLILYIGGKHKIIVDTWYSNIDDEDDEKAQYYDFISLFQIPEMIYI